MAMTSNEYRQQIKQYLIAQFNLAEEQIDSMIPGLIKTLSDHMDNIELVLSSGDLEQLGRTGHTMKGALLNLGLRECAEIAYAIEEKGKAGDDSADYCGMIERMREIIDTYIK